MSQNESIITGCIFNCADQEADAKDAGGGVSGGNAVAHGICCLQLGLVSTSNALTIDQQAIRTMIKNSPSWGLNRGTEFVRNTILEDVGGVMSAAHSCLLRFAACTWPAVNSAKDSNKPPG